MKFADKVVLVAGGTGGLGRPVVLTFLEEGANVCVTWQNEAELAALKHAAGANTCRLAAYETDVTKVGAVGELIDRVSCEKRRLDALINTVGGYAGGAKMWDSDPAALDKMLALNLRSGFLLSRAVSKVMVTQGHGAIVNIAARTAIDPVSGLAAYAASKAAAVAMIKSLALDLKGTGVRANSVLPSIIDTEVNRRAMPGADYAKWPKPEEIAQVILFLCSEDALLIHGASVPVYGNS